ncbi:ketol-acid reductoisomerase [Enterobacteriaceae endosymbiont of Macroplea appendiculata]|uniref:ketol-acid reductoisomerase n=1 Tax=Enterobacteriaceae endosymbiont of Macroplea appendiculata TaxID=2675790 RepID=UPI001448D0FE|nr:ketol-acid reductoisomerase [Enterobacteriaceae endosymbiont of Macroplea appendiculata]QJC30803.1 ketol-acid reductoisomerase [Enterobacteriaceae endosymbiont of Macroplea appendiculata]
MNNYFNTLNFREKLHTLQKSRLMKNKEFDQGVKFLKNKKIVIIGCGAQGLNQGLNMRDSGLDISYALTKNAIMYKNISWKRATKHNFFVGTIQELIPSADLIINLTPDKQHKKVFKNIKPLLKNKVTIGYSHGFNIIEEGEQFPNNINIIMVAPKCPGTEVREEFKRGFGVPALIAIHHNYDHKALEIAKAWAVSIGSHKAGVLESSFAAEVKSDLMGEQTVLCGMLQTASMIFYDKLISMHVKPINASQLIQYGWEYITEALKQGGISLMMDRLDNMSKIHAYQLSKRLKKILQPLFKIHMDDIISGKFAQKMIIDWENNDINLLTWRKQYQQHGFENIVNGQKTLTEQYVFEHGVFMVAIIKASVELSYEIMIETGISNISAYYESLHELPLIANTIKRKKLYEMNKTISDTAEYGNYLFTNRAIPLLQNFIDTLTQEDLGIKKLNTNINNIILLNIQNKIHDHPIEKIGIILRKYMINMKSLQKILC